MRIWTRVLTLLVLAFVVGAVHAQELVTKTFPVYGMGIYSRLSPDGRYLATYEDGILQNNEVFPELLSIRIYDISNGQEVALLDGETDYAADVAFSPDGTQLAALYPTGWVHIWSVADGETVKRMPVAPNALRMLWLADGETLAIAAGLLPQVQLWNVETGAMTALLTERYDTMAEQRAALSAGPVDGLAGFTASADGNRFAVATHYGRIYLWTRDGEQTFLYDSEEEVPTLPIRDLTFTPDGQTLVALNNRADKLLLLDVETAQVREIESPADLVVGLAVSRDGTQAAWLAVTERDVSLLVADIATGEASSYVLNNEDDAGRLTPMVRLNFTGEDAQLVLTGQFDLTNDFESYLATLITLPE
jgi:WD40 repeat protein